MMRACLPPLEQLRFRLEAGEQQEVQLGAATAYAWHVNDGLRLVSLDANLSAWHSVHKAGSDAAKAQLTQQFARQLEALLYLAHRLELDSLAQALHSCVRYNTAWVSSLLRDNASTVNPRVLSARVLEAAAGPGQHSQRAFTNSLVAQPVSFVPGFARRQVFRQLVSVQQLQPGTIKLTAELTEDFMGAGSKGQRVPIELDLFGKGVAKVGADVHVAQLLLGPRVSDNAFGRLVAAHQLEAAAAE
jgi:hypothetical protein